jgi:hypothetical protein
VAASTALWCDKLGLWRLHVRILRGLYRWARLALLETWDGVPTGLSSLLRYRSREWWVRVSEEMGLRVRSRTTQAWRHATNVPRGGVEDVLVHYHGLGWRARAADPVLWAAHEARFCQALCVKYGLPEGALVQAAAHRGGGARVSTSGTAAL